MGYGLSAFLKRLKGVFPSFLFASRSAHATVRFPQNRKNEKWGGGGHNTKRKKNIIAPPKKAAPRSVEALLNSKSLVCSAVKVLSDAQVHAQTHRYSLVGHIERRKVVTTEKRESFDLAL